MHEYARFADCFGIPEMSIFLSPGSRRRAASARALVRTVLSCMLLAGPLVAEPCFPETHAPGNSLLEQLPQRWLDDQGRDTSLSEFGGRPVFFTMAYATCRRVCPMTMARLQQLQREIDTRGQSAEIVIVGYDPAVDDPQAWRQYRRSRGLSRNNWHFLTGTLADTEQLARRLGFTFWKYDRHVMHDFRIVLIDERGELAAEYGPETVRVLDATADNSSADEQVSEGQN